MLRDITERLAKEIQEEEARPVHDTLDNLYATQAHREYVRGLKRAAEIVEQSIHEEYVEQYDLWCMGEEHD